MYSLEIHVVDNCNLNCKGCTHFCPLVPKSSPPVNLDRICTDLIRLNSIRCTPVQFKILGGEPLLHPDLIGFLPKIRGILPSTEIIIWTNALLLPKMGEVFFSICSEFSIKILITPYSPSKAPAIQEIVNRYDFISYDGYFSGAFWQGPLTERIGNPIENYYKCYIVKGRCFLLKDSRIYQCCYPPFVNYMNQFFNTNFEVHEKDSVDIYSIRNERDFENLLFKPTPFCQYCNGNFQEFPWGPSAFGKTEWIQE